MKKKFIVTTTISEPTEATIKFASLNDWTLVVVGDTKTPHESYRALKNVIYLSPEDQEKLSKTLSDSIGWRSIRRRNLGLLFAYREGADIVATVDDDNIPYDSWGKNLLVGNEVEVNVYDTSLPVFDPLFATNCQDLWHRGFPIQLVPDRDKIFIGKKTVKCLVQADFWDGDPDIDAICRITKRPEVKFRRFHPFVSTKISPFNSQNTFLDRSVLPWYMMIPHVGRMDDIWGSYYLQQQIKRDDPYVVYCQPSVYQARNEHDLIKDFDQELLGYRFNLKLISEGVETVLPDEARKALEIYLKDMSQ
jgi:hypothetical protein